MLENVFYFGPFEVESKLIGFSNIDFFEFIKNLFVAILIGVHKKIPFILNKNHATVLKTQRRWRVNDYQIIGNVTSNMKGIRGNFCFPISYH